MHLQTLIYAPGILGILIIATFVMVRSKRSAFRVYGLFSLSLAIWLTFQYLTDAQIGGGILWIQLASVMSVFMAYLFLIFAYTYSNFHLPSYSGIVITSLPAIILVPLSFTRLFVESVTYSTRGVDFAAGPLFNLQTLLLILYFLAGAFVLVKKIMHTSTNQRQRLYLLLVAFVVGLIGMSLAGFIFPNSEYWQAARPVGVLGMLLIIAYAMVYQGLFDIQFFVVRAAAYLFTLLGMTFIFIAPFVLFVNKLLGKSLDVAQFTLVVVLSMTLLYILQFLKRYFDKLTTRIFFRRYYDPQDVLDQLSDILVRTADLRTLRNETARVLQEALKTPVLHYVLFDDPVKKDVALARRIDGYCIAHGLTIVDADEINAKGEGLVSALREAHVAIAVKLQTTHEDMGFMLVGHRQSGQLYTERDKRLLSVAADEIAISLQNVLRFEEIQRFNVTLQDEVDSKTRKLQRQNKRLEELDNIKDDFISMASHQLRTPLTSVKGYLSMVLEGDAGKLTPTQAQMLKQSFSSSQRMVFLITDLLNVSRLKTGKFVIDAIPVDLSEIVKEEVEQLKETAEVKSIKLAYKKPRDFTKLMLDEVKTRQVIMNFIDNAIYYTPNGGHIRIELDDKPGTVEMRVTDDGIGVPRSEQHHLFTKFYRATNARKARPDGTGLGLFMAQKVIIAQGGTVIFSSREGQGSTFGFSFSKSRLKIKPSQQNTPVASSASAPSK